jgi:hypothetical protein
MALQDITSSKTAFRLLVASTYMASLIVAGTILFSLIEGLSYGDSFYFTVETLFSIGYGDLCPVTNTGKMLTTLFIIFGIAGFLASVSILGTWILFKYSKRESKLKKLNLANDKKRRDAVYRWAEKNNVPMKLIDEIIEKTIAEEREK